MSLNAIDQRVKKSGIQFECCTCALKFEAIVYGIYEIFHYFEMPVARRKIEMMICISVQNLHASKTKLYFDSHSWFANHNNPSTKEINIGNKAKWNEMRISIQNQKEKKKKKRFINRERWKEQGWSVRVYVLLQLEHIWFCSETTLLPLSHWLADIGIYSLFGWLRC